MGAGRGCLSVGLRRIKGLDEAVGEGEATFDEVESAGDAETERVGFYLFIFYPSVPLGN